MAQSQQRSALEAGLNLGVGFLLSWALNIWAVPFIFGIHITGSQGLGMVVLFSVSSFARQYLLRRFMTKGD